MITLNASQLDTLIGSRPDVTWRASNFWKYFGQLCRIRHSINQVNVFTPPCNDLIDYSEVDDGFTQYDSERRISCCEKVTRFFVDTFRWFFYGKDERNCRRGRDDEMGHLEMLHEHWSPLTFPVKKMSREVTNGVMLCGIPDAMRSEDGGLVELKSRRNRLFDRIPMYEITQLYVYMFLFEKQEITQIQFHQRKFRVHVIKFDPVIWKRIVLKIRLVRDAINHFKETPEDRVLYIKDPQQFVNKYMRMIS